MTACFDTTSFTQVPTTGMRPQHLPMYGRQPGQRSFLMPNLLQKSLLQNSLLQNSLLWNSLLSY